MAAPTESPTHNHNVPTNVIDTNSTVFLVNNIRPSGTVSAISNGVIATSTTNVVSITRTGQDIMNDIYLSFLTSSSPIHSWTGTGWDTATTCATWTMNNWNEARLYAEANNIKVAGKLLRPNPRPIRSAIKKGLKLITGLGFNDEIRCFLGGSGVEVYHPESDFKFVLTKDQSIIQRTQYPGYSTPYKLELYTKENLFVSKLCVIMESTPVLDQVLAMIMFIRSGDEDQILRQANYPGLTEDKELRHLIALKHPHLREKMRIDDSDNGVLAGANGCVTGSTQGWYINAASACG